MTTKAEQIAALQAQLTALAAEPDEPEQTTSDIINEDPAGFVSQLHHRVSNIEAFLGSQHRNDFKPLPILPEKPKAEGG